MKTKHGVWKDGVWIMKSKKEQLLLELGETFREQWILKRKVLSLGHRIAEINKELGQ